MVNMPYARRYAAASAAKRARVGDIVTRASIQASVINKMLDVEHKHIESQYSNVTLGTIGIGGSSFFMTGIAEGDGINQRIGRKVNFLSSYLTGRLKFSAGGASDNALVRLIVVRDVSSSGSAPSLSDILQYPTFPTSPYTIEKVGPRWTVISSLVYGMSFMDSVVVVDEYKKISDGSASFSGTSGSLAQSVSGQLYLFAVVELDPTNSNSVTFDGSWRGMYTDA